MMSTRRLQRLGHMKRMPEEHIVKPYSKTNSVEEAGEQKETTEGEDMEGSVRRGPRDEKHYKLEKLSKRLNSRKKAKYI